MRNILSLTLLALSLGLVVGTDYCKTSCGGSQNIGCNNNGVSHPIPDRDSLSFDIIIISL